MGINFMMGLSIASSYSSFFDICTVVGAVFGFIGIVVGVWALIITYKVEGKAKNVETLVKANRQDQLLTDQWDMFRGFLAEDVERAKEELDDGKKDTACLVVEIIGNLIKRDKTLSPAFSDLVSAKELIKQKTKRSLKELKQVLCAWAGPLRMAYSQISQKNEEELDKTAKEMEQLPKENKEMADKITH